MVQNVDWLTIWHGGAISNLCTKNGVRLSRASIYLISAWSLSAMGSKLPAVCCNLQGTLCVVAARRRYPKLCAYGTSVIHSTSDGPCMLCTRGWAAM